MSKETFKRQPSTTCERWNIKCDFALPTKGGKWCPLDGKMICHEQVIKDRNFKAKVRDYQRKTRGKYGIEHEPNKD